MSDPTKFISGTVENLGYIVVNINQIELKEENLNNYIF